MPMQHHNTSQKKTIQNTNIPFYKFKQKKHTLKKSLNKPKIHDTKQKKTKNSRYTTRHDTISPLHFKKEGVHLKIKKKLT